MKKLALAALVLLPIALAGCSTDSSAPSSSPTETTVDANEAACHDYGEATAVSVLLAIVLAVLSWLYFKLTDRWSTT